MSLQREHPALHQLPFLAPHHQRQVTAAHHQLHHRRFRWRLHLRHRRPGLCRSQPDSQWAGRRRSLPPGCSSCLRDQGRVWGIARELVRLRKGLVPGWGFLWGGIWGSHQRGESVSCRLCPVQRKFLPRRSKLSPTTRRQCLLLASLLRHQLQAPSLFGRAHPTLPLHPPPKVPCQKCLANCASLADEICLPLDDAVPSKEARGRVIAILWLTAQASHGQRQPQKQTSMTASRLRQLRQL